MDVASNVLHAVKKRKVEKPKCIDANSVQLCSTDVVLNKTAVSSKKLNKELLETRREIARKYVEKYQISCPDNKFYSPTKCSVCYMPRCQSHRVKNNIVIYCPYADDEIIQTNVDKQSRGLANIRCKKYNKKRK